MQCTRLDVRRENPPGEERTRGNVSTLYTRKGGAVIQKILAGLKKPRNQREGRWKDFVSAPPEQKNPGNSVWKSPKSRRYRQQIKRDGRKRRKDTRQRRSEHEAKLPSLVLRHLSKQESKLDRIHKSNKNWTGAGRKGDRRLVQICLKGFRKDEAFNLCTIENEKSLGVSQGRTPARKKRHRKKSIATTRDPFNA